MKFSPEMGLMARKKPILFGGSRSKVKVTRGQFPVFEVISYLRNYLDDQAEIFTKVARYKDKFNAHDYSRPTFAVQDLGQVVRENRQMTLRLPLGSRWS